MGRGGSLRGKGRSKAHSSGRLGRDLETTALCPVPPQLIQLEGSLSPPSTEARMVLRLHAVPHKLRHVARNLSVSRRKVFDVSK